MESLVTPRGFTMIRHFFAMFYYVISIALLSSCAINKHVPPGHYIVQPGDFLEKIAASYNQNVHELAEWNDISWPYTLTPSWQIRVERPANHQAHLKFYETVPGDTWEKVASREHLSVEFLKQWNWNLGIPKCCVIDSGLKLLVSPPKGFVYSQGKEPLPLPSSPCHSQKFATVTKGKGWYDVVVRQCGCPQSSLAEMQIMNGTNALRQRQKICCYCAKP